MAQLFDVEGRLVAVEGETASVLKAGTWIRVSGKLLARKAEVDGVYLTEAQARAQFPDMPKSLNSIRTIN